MLKRILATLQGAVSVAVGLTTAVFVLSLLIPIGVEQGVFGGLSGILASPFLLTTREGGSATTTEQFGSILPQIDNLFNLGSPSRRWRDLNLGGNLNAVDVTITGTCSGCSGGITFPLSQAVTFSANNQYDLGQSTSSARDVYASGTAYLGQFNINGAVTSTSAAAGISSLGLSAGYLTLTGSGSSSIAGNLAVTGNLSSNLLLVSGNASSTFTSGANALGLNASYLTLTGSGTSSLVGNLSVNNIATSRLAVTGSSSSTIAGGLRVTGGLLRVTGLTNCDTINTDADGQLFCGTDADSGASTAFGGHSGFHIFPTSNNTFNLGFTTSSWKDIYASGTVYIGGNGTAKNVGILFATTGTIKSTATETQQYAALALDTTNTVSTSGRLLSIRENGSELSYFDGDGGLSAASTTIAGISTFKGNSIFYTNLLPDASGGATIGSASLPFNTIYLSGSVTIGNTNLTATSLTSTNNTLSLGSAAAGLKNIFASSTAFLSGIFTGGHIIPYRAGGDGNNVYSLGSVTSSFRHLYVSSTIYSQGGIISPTTTFKLRLFDQATTATNRLYDGYFMIPTKVTGCIVRAQAASSSVQGNSYASIWDINTHGTTPGLATTTVFSTTTNRPQLSGGSLTSSTWNILNTSSFVEGTILSVDVDQSNGHEKTSLYLQCRKSE